MLYLLLQLRFIHLRTWAHRVTVITVKRIGTTLAILVIFMAGFMSVCAADDNCIHEASHTSTDGMTDVHASPAPSKNPAQGHCGMLCHVAPYNIPQAIVTHVTSSPAEGRIPNTDTTISLGLYTVLDQPPRA